MTTGVVLLLFCVGIVGGGTQCRIMWIKSDSMGERAEGIVRQLMNSPYSPVECINTCKILADALDDVGFEAWMVLRDETKPLITILRECEFISLDVMFVINYLKSKLPDAMAIYTFPQGESR